MLRFGKLGEVGDAVGSPAEARYSACVTVVHSELSRCMLLLGVVSNIGTLQSHAFKSFSHDFPICSESFDGKRLGAYTRQLWDIHYSSSSFRPPAFFSFLER